MPEPFFAILSQTPSEVAWCWSSHASHAAPDEKVSFGSESAATTRSTLPAPRAPTAPRGGMLPEAAKVIRPLRRTPPMGGGRRSLALSRPLFTSCPRFAPRAGRWDASPQSAVLGGTRPPHAGPGRRDQRADRACGPEGGAPRCAG